MATTRHRWLVRLSPGLLAAMLLTGCSCPIPPEPDLHVAAKPMPLAGRPAKEVEAYLKQFPSYHSRRRFGVRTLCARDHGKHLSAEVAEGLCRSVRISGRLGESLFPRSPGDLAELRDAYARSSSWQSVPRSARSTPVDPLSGAYEWVSTDPPLSATAGWTFDSPARKTARYELTIRTGNAAD